MKKRRHQGVATSGANKRRSNKRIRFFIINCERVCCSNQTAGTYTHMQKKNGTKWIQMTDADKSVELIVIWRLVDETHDSFREWTTGKFCARTIHRCRAKSTRILWVAISASLSETWASILFVKWVNKCLFFFAACLAPLLTSFNFLFFRYAHKERN